MPEYAYIEECVGRLAIRCARQRGRARAGCGGSTLVWEPTVSLSYTPAKGNRPPGEEAAGSISGWIRTVAERLRRSLVVDNAVPAAAVLAHALRVGDAIETLRPLVSRVA